MTRQASSVSPRRAGGRRRESGVLGFLRCSEAIERVASVYGQVPIELGPAFTVESLVEAVADLQNFFRSSKFAADMQEHPGGVGKTVVEDNLGDGPSA